MTFSSLHLQRTTTTITNTTAHPRTTKSNSLSTQNHKMTSTSFFQVHFSHHNLCLRILVTTLMFSTHTASTTMMSFWNVQFLHRSNMRPTRHQRKKRSRKRSRGTIINALIHRQWQLMSIAKDRRDEAIKILTRTLHLTT